MRCRYRARGAGPRSSARCRTPRSGRSASPLIPAVVTQEEHTACRHLHVVRPGDRPDVSLLFTVDPLDGDSMISGIRRRHRSARSRDRVAAPNSPDRPAASTVPKAASSIPAISKPRPARIRRLSLVARGTAAQCRRALSADVGEDTGGLAGHCSGAGRPAFGADRYLAAPDGRTPMDTAVSHDRRRRRPMWSRHGSPRAGQRDVQAVGVPAAGARRVAGGARGSRPTAAPRPVGAGRRGGPGD